MLLNCLICQQFVILYLKNHFFYKPKCFLELCQRVCDLVQTNSHLEDLKTCGLHNFCMSVWRHLFCMNLLNIMQVLFVDQTISTRLVNRPNFYVKIRSELKNIGLNPAQTGKSTLNPELHLKNKLVDR